MVEYSSAVLYVACIVLADKNLVNTLCTDNSSEYRGYLGQLCAPKRSRERSRDSTSPIEHMHLAQITCFYGAIGWTLGDIMYSVAPHAPH